MDRGCRTRPFCLKWKYYLYCFANIDVKHEFGTLYISLSLSLFWMKIFTRWRRISMQKPSFAAFNPEICMNAMGSALLIFLGSEAGFHKKDFRVWSTNYSQISFIWVTRLWYFFCLGGWVPQKKVLGLCAGYHHFFWLRVRSTNYSGSWTRDHKLLGVGFTNKFDWVGSNLLGPGSTNLFGWVWLHCYIFLIFWFWWVQEIFWRGFCSTHSFG